MKIPTQKPRSRSAMIAYLAEHPRYDTMNSWNRATSYAQCVKVTHLDLTREQTHACLAVLEAEMSLELSGFNGQLRGFDERWDHAWQIGQNGRSGGYLVLYQGGRQPSGYRSVCGNCGQLNYRTTAETGKSCGRCGEEARRDFPADRPHMRSFCRPGRGVDMDGDFADWETCELRDRVEVVRDFDRTCRQAVDCFVAFAEGHKVEDRTILVPKTIRVAVPA